TFNFLGFTHICGKTHRGRFRVERQTMAKRSRAKLAEIWADLKRRRHDPVPILGEWLRSILRGHYRYYGVPLNFAALRRFRWQTKKLWHNALARRSQKGRLVWARTERLAERWLPPPSIYHPYPAERFDARIQGKSRVR